MMNKINENRYHLFVLRHGKASDGELSGDFDRSLTVTGVEQAKQIGEWMNVHDLKPDVVFSSPAKRALMTTEIVAGKLNIEPQKIHLTRYMKPILMPCLRYWQAVQQKIVKYYWSVIILLWSI